MKTQSTSVLQLAWRLRGILLWATLFLVITVAAVFALTGGKAQQLAADRVESVATVTKAENYWGADTLVRKKGASVRKADISFSFETKEGRAITGTKHRPNVSRDYVVGETFPVWYSESSPETYELAIGHQDRNTAAWRWLASIFACVFFVYFVSLPIVRAKQLITIRENGEALTAIVIDPPRQEVERGLGDHVHWKAERQPPGCSEFALPQQDRPSVGSKIAIYQHGTGSAWEQEVGSR